MNRSELEQQIKNLIDEYLFSETGISHNEYETILDTEINTSTFYKTGMKLDKCEKTLKKIANLLEKIDYFYSIDEAHYQKISEITEIRNKFKCYR